MARLTTIIELVSTTRGDDPPLLEGRDFSVVRYVEAGEVGPSVADRLSYAGGVATEVDGGGANIAAGAEVVTFFDAGRRVSVAEVHASSASADSRETQQDTKTARDRQFAKLNAWWDTHAGILLEEGVVLPIETTKRNANEGRVNNWLHREKPKGASAGPVKLSDVNDHTVTVAAENVEAYLEAFEAAYWPIAEAWDTASKALLAATSVAEVEAVAIPATVSVPIDAFAEPAEPEPGEWI